MKLDKQHEELVFLGMYMTLISDGTKKLQETSINIYSKLLEQKKKLYLLTTYVDERLWEYECQKQTWNQNWQGQIVNWNKHCQQYCIHTRWQHQKHDYSWYETILYRIKSTFLFFWSATQWPIEMIASKNTWRVNTCTKVHQT